MTAAKTGPICKSAFIDGDYRYWLKREWDTSLPLLGVVMLNPSTADGETDDRTIESLYRLTRTNGYGGFLVGNLFALRNKDPKVLLSHPEPVGPSNDAQLDRLLQSVCGPGGSRTVLVAWGGGDAPRVLARADVVVSQLVKSGASLVCVGACQNGAPRHPLYLAAETRFVPYGEEGD